MELSILLTDAPGRAITVPADTTVHLLRHRLRRSLCVPPWGLRLLFQGSQLGAADLRRCADGGCEDVEDQRTLASYGVRAGSAIRVEPRAGFVAEWCEDGDVESDDEAAPGGGPVAPAAPAPARPAAAGGPEYGQAIAYVTDVKRRFAGEQQGDTYREFLATLHRYQKERRMVKEVIEAVAVLFCDHDDLLQGFVYFLPDAVQASVSAIARGGFT